MNKLSDYMINEILKDKNKKEILEYIDLDLYNEKQKIEILFGIKHGCKIEQLKVCTNKFEARELQTIIECFLLGLSVEQVEIIANQDFNFMQMIELKNAFERGLTIEQVQSFAIPFLSPQHIRTACLSILYRDKTSKAKKLFLGGKL